MTQKELNEILDKHSKWLNDEDGGEPAVLRDADLSGIDLSHRDLRGVDLRYSDLRYSNLRGTNLRFSDLRGTNLSYGDLSYSDLRSTELSGADLTRAVYTNTVLNLQCPEEGSFIAWKKLAYDKIAKLIIPWDAKRSSATSRKCRASKAIVMAIYNKNGEEVSEGASQRYDGFIYRVGETVYSDRWDEDRWNECSHGIHFFITRKEAEEY